MIKIFIGITTVIIVGFFIGFYHLIYGSNCGVRIINKITFSLNETIINLDEVTNMPLFAAKIKYPLSVKALQNAGIIESDEQLLERVNQKVNDDLKKYQNQIQKESAELAQKLFNTP